MSTHLPHTKSLVEERDQFVAERISAALQQSAGSVTAAARRLGLKYQTLIYWLNTRHRDLLPLRTPAKTRLKSIIKGNRQ